MLSRLLPKPSRFSLLTRISSKFHPCPHPRIPSRPQNPTSFPTFLPRFFSTGGDDHSPPDLWKLSKETDENFDPLFGDGSGEVSGTAEAGSRKGGDEWETAEGFRPWSLGGGEEKIDDLFKVGDGFRGNSGVEIEEEEDGEKRIEEAKRLEQKEKELTAVLKGPNRAFGDLIAASGITDEMLDSLIALKDFQGIKGLPPLEEIEDIRYQKNTSKSSRADIERQKQEEVAKARVRQVDDKERAYGTGRRKCSVARVWILPGQGNFVINDKQFDVYFPMLDHRAAILLPFSETKTLGLWDINCTVQGGGLSGQVGAIQLGVSRALQNWEPDLRPTLKASGFLTRDSRVVERKKPGKAKARKSFQWVKR
ncbi:PREDICTED: 28S ribosomal protein S9, mitochondrial [Fragaria vesca subsp. vesca]|uniref:28S ribosomal protein S9, mitochondrial n=1 Tax=Fragaria vesca subsp. vesca TaxID=101020 RepID=UPI0002C335D5|nr:PREDICTED: 28S ribosomal protein S9, mitochondrial [Fragaria vesca subsp. vesca]